MSLPVVVNFATFVWLSAQHILDVEVVLGSADKSSSCKVVLSDLDHKIAAALVNHSLSNGGIQPITDTDKTPEVIIPGIKPESGTDSTSSAVPPFVLKDVKPVNGGLGTKTSMASTGGVYTPKVKAFLDTVVKRESNGATTDIARSYRSVNLGSGFFAESELKKSRSQINEYGNYIGRYQMGKLGEGEAKKRFNLPSLDFSPMSQDIMAYNKLIYRRALPPLEAGDIKTALLLVANEWVSIPNPKAQNQQIQAGTTLQEFIDYYYQRLAYYESEAGTTSTKAPKPESKLEPPDPSKTDTTTPVIKGSKIVITIAGTSFEFIHQGTETDANGRTTLLGQGLRWIMSRRKRSATYKDLSLKQLAQKVAMANKLRLDYQATLDPMYEHVDQSGISDYQLLLREVEANGLMITETKDTLVVKERRQLSDSNFVLSRGLNLIDYKITDRALSSADAELSKSLPQTAKTVIDPVTGTSQSLVKDVDGGSSESVSGSSTTKTAGVIKGGSAQATKELAATSRVAGLPSNFVVPLSLDTLGLAPLSTMVTKGFPGVLDRIWVIKRLTHRVADNTTTLELVSPVEALDSNPSTNIPGIKAEGGSSSKVPTSSERGWVYPCDGICTSPFGLRTHPITGKKGSHHSGQDIAAPLLTPIYAVKSGIVSFVGVKPYGGGNELHITHDSTHKTKYLHLQEFLVKAGDTVTQGQKVALMGNTGGSTGSHLHFTLSENGPNIDPVKYFPKMRRGQRTVAKEPT